MARNVASWLKKILPDNFAQRQAEFHQMEMFLKSFYEPKILVQLQLMSCSGKRVVIAAKSPQAAGYLKLNQANLEAQLHIQLNVAYRVLIKTNPKNSDLAVPKKVILPKVKRSSLASKAVQQVALVIEDDALQKSLQKLAKSLNKKN